MASTTSYITSLHIATHQIILSYVMLSNVMLRYDKQYDMLHLAEIFFILRL